MIRSADEVSATCEAVEVTTVRAIAPIKKHKNMLTSPFFVIVKTFIKNPPVKPMLTGGFLVLIMGAFSVMVPEFPMLFRLLSLSQQRALQKVHHGFYQQ